MATPWRSSAARKKSEGRKRESGGACRRATGAPPTSGLTGRGRFRGFAGLGGGRTGVAVGIPAAATQLEGGHRHQLAHRPLTFRAGAQWRFADLLLHLKDLVASLAFVLVNRHLSSPILVKRNWSRRRRLTTADTANHGCSAPLGRRQNNARRPLCQLRGNRQGGIGAAGPIFLDGLLFPSLSGILFGLSIREFPCPCQPSAATPQP